MYEDIGPMINECNLLNPNDGKWPRQGLFLPIKNELFSLQKIRLREQGEIL